ncbi:MAG: leucyl aminopeptidase family protein, partial [Abditibacteriaceae bacterium]
MQIIAQSLSQTPLTSLETPCLILSIWQDEVLSASTASINGALNGMIAAAIQEDGFDGKLGSTKVLFTASVITAQRVILLGLGNRNKFSESAFTLAAAKAARAARQIKRDAFALVLPDAISVSALSNAATQGALMGLHVYTDFLSEDAKPATVNQITILSDNTEEAKSGIADGQLIGEANLRVRHLVDTPSNLKSPQTLAAEAEKIAKENNLVCEVWDEVRIEAERMGALHGVGMGSANPPRLIRLEHCPAGKENEKPLVLVGKGVTYDTGGYSLKSTSNMDTMKDDMGGAAVVIALMEAVGKAKPNRRIIGLIGSVENMVSDRAQRPGDMVRARNGKTIEVLNTDAEGRLVLADVLSLASELNPSAIIDLATLTGAIGIALGDEAAGLFSNDDKLANTIFEAGMQTGEKVWRFPLWEEYESHMKGKNTDLKNTGKERRAGSISAAIFLQNFVGKDIPWAHIDIAAVTYLREDRG